MTKEPKETVVVEEPKVEPTVEPVVEPAVEPEVVETPPVSPITVTEGEARSNKEEGEPVEEPVGKEETPLEEEKEGIVEEPEKPAMISRELAEQRINRLYARYKKEQEKNVAPPVALTPAPPKLDEYGDPVPATPAVPAGLTMEQAQAIWDQRERQKQLKESFITVASRHPDMLDDNGNFNMKSEFAKTYVHIGDTNPALTNMVNGPEIAEAMVEKQLGLLTATTKKAYKTGRIDAAKDAAIKKGAHTAASTVAVSATKVLELSDAQKHVANKMKMTFVEYGDYLKQVKSGNKRVIV